MACVISIPWRSKLHKALIMVKGVARCLWMLPLAALLFVLNLVYGAVDIPAGEVVSVLLGHPAAKPSWAFIVLESRLPQAITAMLSGGALAVSGLMLQTAFRNPLADPSIFGISSGAGVGVALALLLFGGTVTVGSYSTTGFVAVVMAAFAGAMAVMAIVFLFSIVVRNNVMLLIIGIMVGYLASSVTSLLNFFATEEGVKSYVVWGMGDFSGVSMRQLPAFATIIIAGMFGAVLLIKPLNLLLLGEGYARNLGVSVVRVRNWLLVITGLLTAVVTACCGPVSFIGLAVPHIARLLIPVSDHRILLPSTILMGAVVALACNLFCVLPGGGGIIPLNAVTPIIGSPVIIYIIMRNRS